MTKSIFKKALALVLGIMLVLTAVSGAMLTVLAEDPDWAGTEEDGIVNDDYPEGTTVGLVNGDFSKGLKYWGVNYNWDYSGQDDKQITKPTDAVMLKTEGNGNKYVEFKDDVIKGRGITSNIILVSDDYVAVGDQVSVIYKIKGAVGENLQIRFTQEFASGGAQSASPVNSWQSVKLGEKDGWEYWQTACLTNDDVWLGNTPVAARNDGTDDGYAGSDYYAFRLEIQYNSNEANTSGVAVDDFQMVKYGDDGNFYSLEDGEMVLKLEGAMRHKVDESNKILRTFVKTGEAFHSYDLGYQPVSGTAEDGVIAKGYTGALDNTDMVIFDKPMNIDFSEGLKYWFYGEYKERNDIKASDMVDWADGAISLKNKADAEEYASIETYRFKIPNIQAGDKIVLLAKYKATTEAETFSGQDRPVDFTLIQYHENYATQSNDRGLLAGQNVTWVQPSEDWTMAIVDEEEVEYADTLFSIRFKDWRLHGNVVDATGSIDEFIVAKRDANGGLVDCYTGQSISLGGDDVDDGGNNNGGNNNGGNNSGNNGTGSSNGSSTTTGDSFPVMPLAIAAVMAAGSIVVLRKKVR